MRIEYEADQQAPRNGLILLQVFIAGLFCIFALRFWYLQIHKGEYYANKARENRLRLEQRYAPRGLIRDRGGELVAVNEPAYALAVIREDVKDIDATLARVSEWTGVPEAELRETYEKGRRRVKRFQPLILVPDLSFDLLAKIEANALRWPGLDIVVRPKRFYPQGPLLTHILGYVAEANEQELENDGNLALGDTVGKRGLEVTMEQTLRGRKGLAQLEVDASGRRMNQIVVKDPRAGRNLQLSIDLGLQRKAVEVLREQNNVGSVVVMEPFTGQILALVSEPAYDNNGFVEGLSPDEWAAIRDDPRHLLLNRAIQSAYPPGSVFKLVTAGAGLHENMVELDKTVFCGGQYRYGNRTFRCWKKWGHGKVDLMQALVESCDVYFYELGSRLGVDRMEAFAKACGFGEKTGIDLPHERSGLIPGRDWKRRVKGRRWQGGENLNLAIGQGYTLVTPLQVARFLSALLNGGKLLKPSLIATEEPVVQGKVPLGPGQIDIILESMRETVDNRRGTCRALRIKGAVMGGKTGTAQVVRLTEEARGAKTEEIEYRYRDHSWVASWGVMDGRAVVVVCMVEHGGHAGESSMPVVRAVYDYLFLNDKQFPIAEWPHRMDKPFRLLAGAAGNKE